MSAKLTIVLCIAGLPAWGQSCGPRALEGAWGMHLAGTTTISGKPEPAAGLGRLVFTVEGSVSGSSSVNFNGLLLGNPVTGSYELQPDCTVTFSLQDDSGAFQHFQGKFDTEKGRIEFRQTDAGTGEPGVLIRTPESCRPQDLRSSYSFTLSGTASGEGEIHVAPNGSITVTWKSRTGPAVTLPARLVLQPDCIVELELPAAAGNVEPMKLRGLLVDSGGAILAIQTDPEHTASARFVAR